MKVINCQTLGEMCSCILDGEPVFLIRAQDKFAAQAVQKYFDIVNANGGKNKQRTTDCITVIKDWQEKNPNRVKVPD